MIDLSIKQLKKFHGKCAIKSFYKDYVSEITYECLVERIENVSCVLKQYIPIGSPVGIYMSRSIEMLTVLLALVVNEYPFVFIDKKMPKKRIDSVINEANIAFLITDSDEDIFPEKIKISENIQILRRNVSDDMVYDGLAYILFTSGTSGKPKGVKLTRNNLISFLINIDEVINLSQYSSILGFTNMCFDISILETIVSLFYGLCLFFVTDFYLDNPQKVLRVLEQNKIDIVQFTPSFLRLFYKFMKFDFLNNSKVVLVGGEAFPSELTNELLKNNRIVYNMYGPTEATIWVSCKKIDDGKISIGNKAFNGCAFSVHDDNGNLLGEGEKGELWISGNQIASGYLNLEELTKSRFVVYNNMPTFKSGDLCMIDNDGDFIVFGRIDNQIKIKGYRVELEEIENAIVGYPNIEFAYVKKEGDFLKCYYVCKDQIDIKTLKTYLNEYLPKYMIPFKYEKIESVKFGINGKMIKK